jgi:hypothetical protein
MFSDILILERSTTTNFARDIQSLVISFVLCQPLGYDMR